MKGYKAFNKDLTCKGFQYEIGKEYDLGKEPVVCERGFHFCKNLSDCYQFYGMNEDTRICVIEASGTILTDTDGVKYVTNKIKIVREVKNPREKSNVTKSSSGYCNSGNRNSGYCNSGNCNSGNRNSGNCNSGNRNSGNWNSGNWNSGNWNSGNWNSGNCNSGDWNSGNRNSGDCNSGNRNSGDCNSGNYNSGNRNSGNWNSGVFNTCRNPKIKMFDKESEWTMDDWRNSDARFILDCCPYTYSDFISESSMTDEEKSAHPEYKTIGGFIKVFIATKEDKQKWWDNLSDADKKVVMALPNFDSDKFVECMGIEHI